MTRSLKATHIALALRRVEQGADPIHELKMLLFASLEPRQRQALTFILKHSSPEIVLGVMPRAVAKELRININQASMLCKQLADAGLLKRTLITTEEGKSYVYSSPEYEGTRVQYVPSGSGGR